MPKLVLGDNIEVLKKIPNNSIDSVVTDPPYGLSFMNKKWDHDVPSVEFWREVYRVLKPGGHVLSFGGTRTYHRMVVNIEDAGFEIRDQIQWIYGSGFPKSHNIGKAVDKLQGNEREVVGERDLFGTAIHDGGTRPEGKGSIDITKGQSEWEGWGTALKPANEPICVARKPLSEKSVALNVLKWGTGGINIDGCRVGSDTITTNGGDKFKGDGIYGKYKTCEETQHEGRFPANIILECICDEVIKGEKKYSRKGGLNESDFSKAISPDPDFETAHYSDKGDIHTNPMCPCYMLDEQSGVSKSSKGVNKGRKNGVHNYGFKGEEPFEFGHNDKGGASRFFYRAKVSKAERNMSMDDKNTHPTVKPVSLMNYLCRLITPPNGIILDPYMGSGSTGIAAQLSDFKFVGIEMDKDYFNIAESRIKNFEDYRKFLKN
jgi:DNA modification methylase